MLWKEKNLESKELTPQPLQAGMINLYKTDKAMCAKHLAALHGGYSSVSYRDLSDRGRREATIKRNVRRANYVVDKNGEFGPPDHSYNFDLNSQRGTKRPPEQCTEKEPPKKKSSNLYRSEMDDFMPTKKSKSKQLAKKTNTVTESSKTSTSFHECNKEYLGQNIKMRFKLDNGNYEWYEGQILQFDPTSGKYGAFFPCDGQTVYIVNKSLHNYYSYV